jgi:hypothetical protein
VYARSNNVDDDEDEPTDPKMSEEMTRGGGPAPARMLTRPLLCVGRMGAGRTLASVGGALGRSSSFEVRLAIDGVAPGPGRLSELIIAGLLRSSSPGRRSLSWLAAAANIPRCESAPKPLPALRPTKREKLNSAAACDWRSTGRIDALRGGEATCD